MLIYNDIVHFLPMFTAGERSRIREQIHNVNSKKYLVDWIEQHIFAT